MVISRYMVCLYDYLFSEWYAVFLSLTITITKNGVDENSWIFVRITITTAVDRKKRKLKLNWRKDICKFFERRKGRGWIIQTPKNWRFSANISKNVLLITFPCHWNIIYFHSFHDCCNYPSMLSNAAVITFE